MSKKLTRQDYEDRLKLPPFSYSGYMLETSMKMYDDAVKWSKVHPYTKPKDMREVSFTGFSTDSIDDNIQIQCECSDQKFSISGGYITFCPICGRAYRVISYIAQYERK